MVQGEVAPSGATDVVHRLIASAHRQLNVDAVYLTEYTLGGVEIHAVAGDGTAVGLEVGSVVAFPDSVSAAAVAGRLPSVVPDTSTNRVARRLAWHRHHRFGAFAAAPVRSSDGRLLGALCAAHRAPRSDLGPTTTTFLAAMADVIARELAAQRQRRQEAARERSAILSLLDEGGMRTVLQPIVDVRDGVTLGVEALTRFSCSTPRPPNVWFAAAARQGLGVELEAAALSRALQLLPALPPSWYLAVNTSPALVLDGMIPDLLLPDVAPRLVLEITEHAAVADYPDLRRALEPLRERGARVAVDDAGAGFASLRHVLEIRPEIVKVDGALVRGIDVDPMHRAMVESLAGFAAHGETTVVAEAVETPNELAVLQDLGVPCAQGYLFASPGDPGDLQATYPVEVPDHLRH